MKICHCVKLTDEEIKAFRTVCSVLNEMDDDAMLNQSFGRYSDLGFCDIRSWLDDVVDFIRRLNE
jgi:hypothetical protein